MLRRILPMLLMLFGVCTTFSHVQAAANNNTMTPDALDQGPQEYRVEKGMPARGITTPEGESLPTKRDLISGEYDPIQTLKDRENQQQADKPAVDDSQQTAMPADAETETPPVDAQQQSLLNVDPNLPLDQPNLPTPEVLNWATRAAVDTFTYNYQDYDQRFLAIADYFSPHGWQEYMRVLQSSGNLQMVKDREIAVRAEQTGKAKVVAQDVEKNRFTWKVEVPIKVTYQGSGGEASQVLNIDMLVTRVKNDVRPNGIGITQFVAMIDQKATNALQRAAEQKAAQEAEAAAAEENELSTQQPVN